ncbi:chromodomain protein, putative [Plasmopara halstedii]|uniref:Chromodomain protein, putative n=1 Tax=Plasmopara halstedii TaxID=4781 RepID=A0A0P1AXH8_PLAHL|nr:chromodomain protein, putative [Plasmopara halstedii]CEG45901.1 chromodomain protein, putative [Plasmopara halstedii]|eukprot:XP_024582270.1 chromodomain protein, putative [Plasmopara halstedii]
MTQHGKYTVLTNDHIPVSVSVADSLIERVRCFVNDDPKMPLTDVLNYIGDVSGKIQQYNVKKYISLLQKIINDHGLTGMNIPGVNLGKTYKMSNVKSWIEEYASFFDFYRSLGFGEQTCDYGKLNQQLDQVPVSGFNSGR